jgi:hypothetical protein
MYSNCSEIGKKWRRYELLIGLVQKTGNWLLLFSAQFILASTHLYLGPRLRTSGAAFPRPQRPTFLRGCAQLGTDSVTELCPSNSTWYFFNSWIHGMEELQTNFLSLLPAGNCSLLKTKPYSLENILALGLPGFEPCPSVVRIWLFTCVRVSIHIRATNRWSLHTTVLLLPQRIMCNSKKLINKSYSQLTVLNYLFIVYLIKLSVAHTE